MKILFFLCISVFIIFSCKQKASQEKDPDTASSRDLQSYEDEILKIHDEVMPKMTEINKLATQLRNIQKNVSEAPENQSVAIEGLNDAFKSLREAEQGMSDWMKNYSDTKSKLQTENLKKFYESELDKIKVVRDNMLNSIEKANKWLETHPAG